MKITGGCYCGNIRYEAEGEPIMRGLCLCRECQYISGGGANVALAMPMDSSIDGVQSVVMRSHRAGTSLCLSSAASSACCPKDEMAAAVWCRWCARLSSGSRRGTSSNFSAIQ